MHKLFVLIILFSLSLHNVLISKEKTVIYTIGDSTVKNGRGDGSGGLWGWGDPIALFFDTTKVKVENCALGGTSSRTFQTKGLWEAVRAKLKKGDYVLMQFGHNDGSALNDSSRARGTIKGVGEEFEEIDNILTKEHETVHSYGWYLRKVVRESKERGAIPVIVTPIPRNDWENGKVRRTPNSYPQWAMEVAKQEKIQSIDLNRLMSDKLDVFGEDKVTGRFFYSRDHTHTSAEGAVLAASLVVEGLKALPKLRMNQFFLVNPSIQFPVKRRVFVIGDSTVANGNDSRDIGAIPIVFSQIPRNEWPEGKVERVSASFGKWAKESADQADAFFVDLNELVAQKYEVLGKDLVRKFFPGDHTHTNAAGAKLNAQTVAEGIKAIRKCELATYVDFSSVSAVPVNTTSTRGFLITRFGAVGDGTTLNTKAIPSAIDQSAANGRGVAVVPQGIFLSGAFF